MTESIRRITFILVVFTLSALIIFLIRSDTDRSTLFNFFRGKGTSNNPTQYTLADTPKLDLTDVPLLTQINKELANLVDTISPSVVSINTLQTFNINTQYVFSLRRGLEIRSREQQVPGFGSGVIVSQEGHIITNHHVAGDKDKIEVTLNNGEKYEAIFLGSDPEMDIAILKINGDNRFTALPFADSDKVRVGEMVFAVGNPFGLNETVTQGIISHKERFFRDGGSGIFQTDTPINPGNSGGPLVNLQGEIIGINFGIHSESRVDRTWHGVGFAIPSNDVKSVFEEIMSGKSPGFLGVSLVDAGLLNPRLKQERFGWKENYGTLVGEVVTNSPADVSGIQEYDVILQCDSQNVRNSKDLIRQIKKNTSRKETLSGSLTKQKKDVSRRDSRPAPLFYGTLNSLLSIHDSFFTKKRFSFLYFLLEVFCC